MKNDTKKITEGAMMLALTSVFLLINRQLGGLFDAYLAYVMPLPMVFYARKYALRYAWILYFATLLFVALFSTMQGMIYGITFPLIGLIYGHGLYTQKNMTKTLLLAMLVAIFTEVFILFALASIYGISMQAQIAAFKQMFTSLADKTGLLLPTFDLDGFIRNIIIISTVMVGIAEVLIVHMLVSVISRRLRMPVPKVTPLKEYYPPKWTGYASLAGLVLYMYTLYQPLENERLQAVLSAIGMIGFVYLSVWGVIALSFLAREYFKVPRLLTVLLVVYCIIAFQQLLSVLAFLYITTNFHKAILEGRSKDHA